MTQEQKIVKAVIHVIIFITCMGWLIYTIGHHWGYDIGFAVGAFAWLLAPQVGSSE